MPILPNLDELRDRLAIPAINTGRQIHLLATLPAQSPMIWKACMPLPTRMATSD